MSAILPPPRPVLRRLRVGLALLSLTLGVFSACLWVRSQAGTDEAEGGFRAHQQIWLYTRPDGLRIRINELRNPATPAWRWRYIAPDEQRFRSPIFPWEHDKQVAGFAYGYSRGNLALAIPYWFLTLSCAVAAVLSAPKFRWQFSLRRLLVIVTCVAVLLGAVVALSNRR